MRYIFLLTLSITLGALAQTNIETREINYTDGEVVLQGFLAYNTVVSGKRPGILIVHEWWGQNNYAQMRATQLAEMGYIAFALDMYGKGILAENAQKASELAGTFYQDRNLMRNRAHAGLKVLKSQTFTDTTRLAAIGFCFGGTVVLELARSGAELDGFVSFHGGLNTPQPENTRSISGAVLVLHGADDPYVKTEEVLRFQEEMRAAKADWQLIYYSGAVHAFTNPAAGNDNSSGAAYNEVAARRSWKTMQVFFQEIFQ